MFAKGANGGKLRRMKNPQTLCILAGGGILPAVVAEAAMQKGFAVHVVTFAGQPLPQNLPQGIQSTQTFPLGAVKRIVAHLKSHKITHILMAGGLNKPSLFALKPDTEGLKLLAKALTFQDDSLLRAVTGYLTQKGFNVIGVAELAPQLLASKGTFSKRAPSKAELADIELAVQTLHLLGKADVGQSVIVHHGTVLGVEAVEGTDALITRCASLRGTLTQPAGILVKFAKPQQTDLADLPTVGAQTMALLAQHQYVGLVVQAQKTLLLQKDEMVSSANSHRMLFMAHAG